MNDQLRAALAYLEQHRERFLDELKAFVQIPSVSADSSAEAEIRRAAEWVAGQLHGLGMQKVAIMPTEGHPVVYGELLSAGKDKPTVLIYGHYDVQPAEPLELWHSPAFEPSQRGENLYGRGASDMKAQVVITLKAVEALVCNGGMPINVKFLVEGEEEIGSPNLEKFLAANKDLLTSDFALNPDTGMISAQVPTITYGLRGLAYFELWLTGPSQDLHSGLFGGAVHNPAQVLCELVAGMHDSRGRVTLPGFYDKVRPLEAEERAELARLPINDETFLEQTGAPALFGEAGYSALERVAIRPTLEVNGLFSGYIGEGPKTVLPAKAMAKISMRLVPDQSPDEVQQQLWEYLRAHVPQSVTWDVLKHAGGNPSVTDRHLPGVTALSRALEETWGIRPVFRREGGSVPVTAQMCNQLGIDSVLTGFGLPDDNLHAPNEKMHLPTFYRGIEAMTRYFSILGES